jgi:hypothetical protein
VSSRAAWRLRIAKDAIRHTKQAIQPANQWETVAATRFNSHMAHLTLAIDGLWDYSRLRSTPDTQTLAAAKAAHLHFGNCGEHAAIAYAYLRKHAPGEFIRICETDDSDDHAFVLIGSPNESDCVAVDPWPTEAKACLWDDHTAYSHTNLTTTTSMVADGRASVEYVRSRIRLRSAGRTVAAWDLRKFKDRGIENIARDLIYYGIRLPDPPTVNDVYDGLVDFAIAEQPYLHKMYDWTDKKLNLWCTSMVDYGVLKRVLRSNSSRPEVVSAAIGEVKAAGRLNKVHHEPNSVQPGHDFHYVS